MVGTRDFHGLSVSEVVMPIVLSVCRHCQGDPSAFGHQSARGTISVLLVQAPPEHHARDVRGEGGLGCRRAGEARWV